MRLRKGRPPKPPDQRFTTSIRPLGRVPEEIWRELKAAATRAGTTFVDWAVSVLLREARKK